MMILDDYHRDGEILPGDGNCLEFAVKNSAGSQFIAKLKLLQSRDLKLIKQGHLLPFLKEPIYIEQSFFIEYQSRVYITSILKPEYINLEGVLFKNVILAPEDCMKLIAEAVNLIKQFHGIGLPFREPFQNYLQISKSSFMSNHFQQLKSFYPVDQILFNKCKVTPFLKIDVWMLGKYFLRVFKAVRQSGVVFNFNFIRNYKQMVAAMTDKPLCQMSKCFSRY